MARFTARLFWFLVAAVAGLVVACVPARQYEDMEARKALYQDSTQLMKSSYAEVIAANEALQAEYQAMQEAHQLLRQDTAQLWQRYRTIETLNKDLNELYEKVIAQNKALLDNSNSEKELYLAQLNEKEAMLNDKNQQLQRKQDALDQQQAALEAQQDVLAAKQARVDELEQVITAQDSAANALKNKVQEAFLDFSPEELSVEQRSGKIYVSMSNKLLFKSGRTDVDQKGIAALATLAGVMQKNPDINIMVEGHTDSIPIARGSALKDNWDLSVLRATSIVRILIDEGIAPERLFPGGRSKYFPVATNETPEGRAMNRRTEVILSPKLDALMDLLQNQ